VDDISSQEKSVATSETGKTRESNKMSSTWYSKEKYINKIKNYKKRRKKKFEAKDNLKRSKKRRNPLRSKPRLNLKKRLCGPLYPHLGPHIPSDLIEFYFDPVCAALGAINSARTTCALT
jgi:hypothetical protein